MTALPLSVIVVSRGRPEALARCLRGIAALDGGPFEVVVVADPAGIAAVAAYRERIKAATFDEANIARARNIGLGLAAGEVVAFIDDDAVPEPTWAMRLLAPFADARAGAAGGPVIGRNGISLQWGPAAADRLGQRRPLQTHPTEVQVHRGAAGLGIKTEGTNMAFRRDLLCRIGGFDERFAFYLDETDVNLRLGALGTPVAFVPGAVVHHGFAASARRREDRVPRDLRQIGASLAVFLRKHGTDPATRRAAEAAAQRRRLLRHMVAGRIEPRDVGRLMAGFEAGWDEGLARAEVAVEIGAVPEFLPFGPGGVRARRVLSGPLRDAVRLRAEAAARAAEGAVVTLILLSRTAQYHRVGFRPAGYWEQAGGLYGRSLRSDPLWRRWDMDTRVAREVARVAPVREAHPRGAPLRDAPSPP